VVYSIGIIIKVIHLADVSTFESNIKERVKSAQDADDFFKIVKMYLEQEPT
jgi:hypothetical protein